MVDHTPTEPVPVANQGQPGEIAINLELDIEADEHRQHEQQPAATENAEENAGEQQQQIGDDPEQVPAQPEHTAIPIDQAQGQAQGQEQSGTFDVGTPDLKG